jgi:hypothetical protein
VWRLVVAFVIGKRTQQSADLLLDRVLYVTDAHIPFFTSDPLPEYRRALLHAYGTWHQPPRQGHRGRYPNPLLMPPPGLLYAQVVKARDHGRIVQVDSKVIFGAPQALAEQLTLLPTSTTIGGVSNVDIAGNNALQITAIGVSISTFETRPKRLSGSYR